MTAKLAYSVAEAAQLIGVSTRSLRYLLQEGRISFIRLGRRVLIKHEDLERLLKQHYCRASGQIDADAPIRPPKQQRPGARATPGHSCNALAGSHPGRNSNDSHKYITPAPPTA
jgi:excisionase family DNA binding protein